MRSIHQSNPRRSEHVPAVERIAPALAGGREVVGRHAGDADRLQILVELEDLRVNPHVGRIHVDEDGHVAQDSDGASRRSLAQLIPLLREGKLQHLFQHALVPVLSGSLRQAPADRGGAAARATRSTRRF